MKNTVMKTACAEVLREGGDEARRSTSEASTNGSVTTQQREPAAARPDAEDRARRRATASGEHDVADADVGHELAEHDLDRRGRRRQHLLVGAALALADEAEARWPRGRGW